MFIFSVITELFYKHAFQSIYTTIDEDTWANDVTTLNMVILSKCCQRKKKLINVLYNQTLN